MELIKTDGKMSGRILATKNIRLELKAKFPNVKFSVTSESYSMGNSINVNWIDGPTTKEVDSIIDKYQKGDFDGMQDIYNYRGGKFNDTFGGSKYVFSNRKVSFETSVKIAELIIPNIQGNLKGKTPKITRSEYDGTGYIAREDEVALFDDNAYDNGFSRYLARLLEKLPFNRIKIDTLNSRGLVAMFWSNRY